VEPQVMLRLVPKVVAASMLALALALRVVLAVPKLALLREKEPLQGTFAMRSERKPERV
jgi:hypothetical protein